MDEFQFFTPSGYTDAEGFQDYQEKVYSVEACYMTAQTPIPTFEQVLMAIFKPERIREIATQMLESQDSDLLDSLDPAQIDAALRVALLSWIEDELDQLSSDEEAQRDAVRGKRLGGFFRKALFKALPKL